MSVNRTFCPPRRRAGRAGCDGAVAQPGSPVCAAPPTRRSDAAEEPAAKPTGHHSSRHESSPIEAAQQALAAGDSAGAYQAIEQAYRTRPAAELPVLARRIAEAEKHPGGGAGLHAPLSAGDQRRQR